MKGVPTDIGTVHFVGIGGIGMSGIVQFTMASVACRAWPDPTIIVT